MFLSLASQTGFLQLRPQYTDLVPQALLFLLDIANGLCPTVCRGEGNFRVFEGLEGFGELAAGQNVKML